MKSWQECQLFLQQIEPADPAWLRRAQERQDVLTKPPGSLGRLEEIANRLCAMQRTLEPHVDNAAILIFAADHGVCEEGVNAFPQAVTRQMVDNFLSGGAAINALAASAQAQLVVVDVGILGLPLEHPNLLSRRIGPGTLNLCREPAMTQREALAAISAGIDCAEGVIRSGCGLLAIGEMGIGNTTVASALCAALTNTDPGAVCGRGTGCDDAAFARKRAAVERAIQLHRPFLSSPLDLLIRLGGFEIASMCGVCLAAARSRVPVVMDGFISTAAAAIAVEMSGAVRDYCLASHESSEPGHRALLSWLGQQPLLQLGMRLGEGTGAALAIPLIRAATWAFRSMATFASAGVAGSIAGLIE